VVPTAHTLLARSRHRAIKVLAGPEPAPLPLGAESAGRARDAFTVGEQIPGPCRLVDVAVIETGTGSALIGA
jgi:hypothetical protein